MAQSKNTAVQVDTSVVPNAVFQQKGSKGTNCFFVEDLNSIVNQMVTISYAFSAHQSNPQGDPDSPDNEPRQDPVTGIGLVTPAGIHCRIRDTMAQKYGATLFIADGANLEEQTRKAAKAVLDIDLSNIESEDEGESEAETETGAPESGKAKGKAKAKQRKLTSEERDAVIAAVCQTYDDVRCFGGVLCKPINRGIKGAVQCTFMRSEHPVSIVTHKLTRRAVANDKEKQSKDRTFGSLSVVRFGLYRGTITVHPTSAEKTKLTWQDLNKILDALQTMWSMSASGLRPDVRFERMDIFLHDSAYGSCSEKTLRKALTVKYVGDTSESMDPSPNTMDDYEFVYDGTVLPAGVQHIVLE